MTRFPGKSLTLNPCPFCDKPGPSLDAHIIPLAFFERIRNGNTLRQREPGFHSKKRPKGVYDCALWCLDCERNYGKWDSDAAAVFLGGHAFEHRDGADFLKTERVSQLRLFCLSLLWRASASSERLYRRVQLGPFADDVAERLRANDPGPPGEFSVIVSTSGHDASVIAEPVMCRVKGVRFYKFHLGKYVVHIKVDSQPCPETLYPAVLGVEDGLVVLRSKRDAGLVGSLNALAHEQIRRGGFANLRGRIAPG